MIGCSAWTWAQIHYMWQRKALLRKSGSQIPYSLVKIVTYLLVLSSSLLSTLAVYA